MFIDPFIRTRGVENDQLAERLVAWLSGGAEQLAVRPKPAEVAVGRLDPVGVRTVRLIAVGVIPSIFVLIGSVVWLVRRK